MRSLAQGRRRLGSGMAALGVLVALASAGLSQDLVHLKRGGFEKGQLQSISDTEVRLRISLAGGAGSSLRRIPRDDVKLIDFAPAAGEEALLEAGSGAAKVELTALWAGKRKYLGFPNSNAGQVGLQLGEVLLASADAADHANAKNLYLIVESGDWDLKRRALAKGGRLQALVKLGEVEEVMAEAQRIAREGGDPQLLLDARHVLANAELGELRELVKENPKWREDDRIGPQVERRYHRLLDGFLEPFLFYGTHSHAAARGLLHAAETYLLIEEPEHARECLTDIEKLYSGALPEELLRITQDKLPIQNDENTDEQE